VFVYFYATPWAGRLRSYAHILVHLVKSAVGLLEEVKDDAPAEFSLILIIVHFENLLEGCDIDVVAKVAKSDGTVLVLVTHVLALEFYGKTSAASMYLYFSCRHFGVLLTRGLGVRRGEAGAFAGLRLWCSGESRGELVELLTVLIG
jgi:hypothetical protein